MGGCPYRNHYQWLYQRRFIYRCIGPLSQPYLFLPSGSQCVGKGYDQPGCQQETGRFQDTLVLCNQRIIQQYGQVKVDRTAGRFWRDQLHHTASSSGQQRWVCLGRYLQYQRYCIGLQLWWRDSTSRYLQRVQGGCMEPERKDGFIWWFRCGRRIQSLDRNTQR